MASTPLPPWALRLPAVLRHEPQFRLLLRCFARTFHVSTLGDALRGLKLLFPLTRKDLFFPLTS